jgi:hypothetical protein
MAKQIIDLGTSPNKGDGDPLRTAFDKVNDNFDELYLALGNPSGATTDVLPDSDATIDLGSAAKQWADLHVADFIYLNGARIEVTAGGALLVNGGAPAEVQDTVGSVFGDDSTLLVDGVNGVIPSANISGTEATNWDTAFSWGDHSAAGYLTDLTGDLQGSVFADDSTLLVDGVNSKINLQNTVLNNTISTTDEVLYLNTASTPGERGFKVSTTDSIFDIYGATLEDGNGGGLWLSGGIAEPGMQGGDVIISGRIISLLGGDGAGNGGIALSGPIIGTIDGDLTGSVFADDSTTLVDGVNGVIPSVEQLKADIKAAAAASIDFTDFQTRIAAL